MNNNDESLINVLANVSDKDSILKKISDNIIGLFVIVAEARNYESGGHILRVKGFTEIIAGDIMNNYPQYGLTPEKVSRIVSASVIHDIGKITIPDRVLLKPGVLTADEYELMKTHTEKGAELIDKARSIWGDEFADICRDITLYHHERYDGNGYPKGLVGDEIPISAQIVSLADVYDALVARRVYKKRVPPDVAVEMISRGECGSFSGQMIACLRRQKENLEALGKGPTGSQKTV